MRGMLLSIKQIVFFSIHNLGNEIEREVQATIRYDKVM